MLASYPKFSLPQPPIYGIVCIQARPAIDGVPLCLCLRSKLQ